MDLYICTLISYLISLIPGFFYIGIIIDLFLLILLTLLDLKKNNYKHITYNNKLYKNFIIIIIIAFIYYFTISIIYLINFLNNLNIDIDFYYIIGFGIISLCISFIETYNAYHICLYIIKYFDKKEETNIIILKNYNTFNF